MHRLKYLRFFLLFSISSISLLCYSQNIKPKIIIEDFSKNELNSRGCIAPSELAIEIDTVEYDQYLLNLSWSMNEPDPGWIHWDDGVNYAGIGCCPHLSVAARWDSGQLAEFHNYRISKMKIFINQTYFDSLIFKIWNGNKETDLIYHDTIFEYGEEVWVEHELISNVYLDASNEIWIGCSVRDMPAGTFTFGVDEGPAKKGYGDMLREDRDFPTDWDPMSDFGLDYNFNIQFYVEDTAGNEIAVGRSSSIQNERNIHLSGYNLYQSIDGGDYELLEFIPYEPGDTSHSILFDANPKMHCYQLTAVWESIIDSCESAAAKSKENPDENYVCVLLVGSDDKIKQQTELVKCYPNPFSKTTTFEYELNKASTVQISIFDQFGEQIEMINQKQSAGKQHINWSAEGLSQGVYYYTFRAGNQVASGKLVVM